MVTDLAIWQRRDARRREQYRAYVKRKRWGSPVAWLHAIRCERGRGYHRSVKACQPIPIYDPRLVDDG